MSEKLNGREEHNVKHEGDEGENGDLGMESEGLSSKAKGNKENIRSITYI
jgi:hypothetical protein